MKRFLITSVLDEKFIKKKTIYLGHWALKFNKKNILNNLKGINIHQYHWSNKKKLEKDFNFLKIKNEEIVKRITPILNKIHNKNYNNFFWFVVLYPWLSQYSSIMLDRWETVRTFLSKNKKKYTVYDIFPENYFITSKDHFTFFKKAAFNDEWNHELINRIFKNFKSKKIILEKKFYNIKNSEKKIRSGFELQSFFYKPLLIIDNLLSPIAFKYNYIIFESFYYPLKEYVFMCLKNLLIPAKYLSFFNYESSNEKTDLVKRNRLKSDLFKIKEKNSFMKFLYENIHIDLPLNYLENFEFLRQKSEKISNKSKMIFSMHSWNYNDFFKIFLAHSILKNKSKLVISDHGGGLDKGLNLLNSVYHNRVSYKKISWKKNNSRLNLNLSPLHSIISKKLKKKEQKKKKFLTILFSECSRYQNRIDTIPYFSDEVESFIEFMQGSRKLKPNLKKIVKFRIKDSYSINADKIFSEVFGKSTLVDFKKESFIKTLNKSKLILSNYPTTSYTEAMFLNLPIILFCKKSVRMYRNENLKIFNLLKKHNMAFDNYEKLIIFINNNWHKVDDWWNNDMVQKTRSLYLKNFFNVKKTWANDWSNYIYSVNKQ